MFDLFRSREKATRYLLGGLLFAVAASMVITLIPGFGSNTGNTTSADPTILAEIGNEKLSGQEAQTMFQQVTNQPNINPDMLAAYFPQFVEQMIMQRAAIYEAQRMGMTVTDDELLVGLQSQVPQAFQNGGVDKAAVEQYYLGQGQTLNDGLDGLRKQLLIRKLENSTLQGVVVAPKEVEDEYRKKYERAKVQYIAFPGGKFMDQIKPTDAAIKDYFELNHAKYSVPEKFAYQVLVLDQDKVEAALQISDAQLRQAYASSMDNFRMPERVKVRHILIKAETKASDAEKKAALAKAEDLLKQLKGGADFATLAKKNSADTSSAEKGGEMDFLVAGQTVPEFDKMAFNLPLHQLSPIVTTQFGYHIIEVLEKQPAHVRPFDEVKAGLLADLKKQMVTDKMQTSGDQMRAALAKDPGSAAAIAKEFGADLVDVPSGGPGEPIPGLGVSPEVDQTLAGLQDKGVSQLMTLPGNRLVALVVNHRTAARPALLDEVTDKVKSAYIMERSQKIGHEKAVEAAERIQKGEDVQAVAKSMKLEATTSTEFSRNDSVEGLGPAVYVEEAFSKPAGTVLGPVSIQNKDVVYKVLARTEANMAAFAAEREQMLFGIKQKKAKDRYDLLMDSILAKLTDEGKVKVHRDAIQKLVGSYRR
jgi:peptidyl-prolyl cis-trans isomerase D